MNKVIQYVYYFRFLIFGLLITVLFFLGMRIGAMRACGGYLSGWECMQPKMVDMVAVCEYNDYTCASKCKDFIVNDMAAFRDEYTLTACNNNLALS